MAQTIKDLKRALRAKITGTVVVYCGVLPVETSKTSLLGDIKHYRMDDQTVVVFQLDTVVFDHRGNGKQTLRLRHVGL